MERGVEMSNRRIDLRGALSRMISVSDLGRGKASKVIQEVESHKGQYIVVKNNKPMAIILSVEEYNELLEKKEELGLLRRLSAKAGKDSELSHTLFEVDKLKELNDSTTDQ